MHLDTTHVYMTPDDFLRAITPGLGPAPNGKALSYAYGNFALRFVTNIVTVLISSRLLVLFTDNINWFPLTNQHFDL